jgi:hypothetical protein
VNARFAVQMTARARPRDVARTDRISVDPSGRNDPPRTSAQIGDLELVTESSRREAFRVT